MPGELNALFLQERATLYKSFIADFQSATDIKEMSSLKDDKNFTQQKQLLNMDDLRLSIDNVIEGVILYSPRFTKRPKTLLFVER